MKIRINPLISMLLILLLLIILSGCSNQASTTAPEDDNNKYTVAVSIVPEETFVKAVAGDLADVAVMVPPGYNPENYAPSSKEMTKLSNAIAYFTIGVPAEEVSILPEIKDFNPDIKIIDLASAVNSVYPDREFAPGERDPHTWLSPKRAMVMVRTIADELSALDPANKEIYQSNAQKYINELEQLDSQLQSKLSHLEQRTFIVFHPALGYLAEDYHLNMLAIEEEGKEATAGHITEIIDQAKKENIKVIFYQASMSSRQAEAIAENIGGYTEQIDPLAADYITNLQKIADTFAKILN